MKIENSFTVDAPIDQAWDLLTNIPEIAPCLPGAKLTGEENGVYTGGIKVKVGPVTAEYTGSAEFVEKDEVAHKAVIDGKGRDTRGAGNAQALITAQMQPIGNQTQVDITTDLKVSGKVAQFGRGVMQDISEKLLGQFADCLAAKIGEGQTTAADSGTRGAAEKLSDRARSVAARTASSNGHSASAAESDSVASSDDDDVLDLLDVAGSAMFKRYGPMAGGVVAALLIIWWIVR